jgi:hypothetical protein
MAGSIRWHAKPTRICLRMCYDNGFRSTDKDEHMRAALQFLQEHGPKSLVSLGCGTVVNNIDNHLRLFLARELTYYVGIDCEPAITTSTDRLYTNEAAMRSLFASQHRDLGDFLPSVRLFPDTSVEELADIRCDVVVCQRVLPFLHWEEIIVSMNPALVLQEDLHGCELQMLAGPSYQKYRKGIRHYGLRPFRPWRILPGEFNLILWQQKNATTTSRLDQSRSGTILRRILRILGSAPHP